MEIIKQPIKVIALGDNNVGKSALLNRYVNKHYTPNSRITMEMDLFTKEIFLDNRKFRMQIWDTAGSEKYVALGSVFFRNANCCILVFDVTSQLSFQKLDTWRNEFIMHARPRYPERFPFVLVGNKADKENRQVTTQQALDWCKMHNDMPYFETSAKDDNCVEDVFLSITENFYKELEAEKGSDEDLALFLKPMDIADNSHTPRSTMFCCA